MAARVRLAIWSIQVLGAGARQRMREEWIFEGLIGIALSLTAALARRGSPRVADYAGCCFPLLLSRGFPYSCWCDGRWEN
jgi:hypothetical protein